MKMDLKNIKNFSLKKIQKLINWLYDLLKGYYSTPNVILYHTGEEWYHKTLELLNNDKIFLEKILENEKFLKEKIETSIKLLSSTSSSISSLLNTLFSTLNGNSNLKKTNKFLQTLKM